MEDFIEVSKFKEFIYASGLQLRRRFAFGSGELKMLINTFYFLLLDYVVFLYLFYLFGTLYTHILRDCDVISIICELWIHVIYINYICVFFTYINSYVGCGEIIVVVLE